MGKGIILNTLILLKTAFLSNIFPIPKNILTQLHKKIYRYIWKQKMIEPTARKTLFLPPKKKGGLNIKEPDSHNIAMTLKHLLNLKYQEKPPIWTYLAIYWLAKDINKYGKEYNYLKSNNRTKTLNTDSPFYYKDLIEYFKTQNPNIKKKIITKILYNDIRNKGSENYTIQGEIQWKNKLQNLQFTKIWNNIYYTYGPPHTSDLHYRLIHYATETNQYTYNCSRDKNNLSANCNHCNITEDNLHLFTTCKRIINIWKFYKPTYYKLTTQIIHQFNTF